MFNNVNYLISNYQIGKRCQYNTEILLVHSQFIETNVFVPNQRSWKQSILHSRTWVQEQRNPLHSFWLILAMCLYSKVCTSFILSDLYMFCLCHHNWVASTLLYPSIMQSSSIFKVNSYHTVVFIYYKFNYSSIFTEILKFLQVF